MFVNILVVGNLLGSVVISELKFGLFFGNFQCFQFFLFWKFILEFKVIIINLEDEMYFVIGWWNFMDFYGKFIVVVGYFLLFVLGYFLYIIQCMGGVVCYFKISLQVWCIYQFKF